MNKNEYCLRVASVRDETLPKMLQSYPVLKSYVIRTEYPYPNTEMPRHMIIVDDVIKFHDVIGRDVILCKDICDPDVQGLIIYDDNIE